MNETLTFNNGTVLQNSYAIQVDMVLYIYIKDESCSFEDAFELLNNQNTVSKIICNRYGQKETYEGFTDFYSITKDRMQISAGIRQAV